MKSLGRKHLEKKILKVLKRPHGGMQLTTKEVEKFGYDELRRWGEENGWVVYHVMVKPPTQSGIKLHSVTYIVQNNDDLIQAFRNTTQSLANAYSENQKSGTNPKLLAIHRDILKQYGEQVQELLRKRDAEQAGKPVIVEPPKEELHWIQDRSPVSRLTPELSKKIEVWVNGLALEDNKELTMGGLLENFKVEFKDDIEGLHYEALEKMLRTDFGRTGEELIPMDVKVCDINKFIVGKLPENEAVLTA